MIKLFRDPFFNMVDEFVVNNTFTPKTKVDKNDDGYLVMLAVPGLTKEDLKITTKDNILKISFDGEKTKDDNHFVSTFTKSYTIPDEINEKEIGGKVENGVLTISLPISKKKNLERLVNLN